ncbi:hypothetical protein INT48_006780 [Thamnidium elegans]|uniref:Uncharacterized protein n=1 Tax=Thamnidium elegans TaxID=101142 RepID=A0A8H7VXB4_9FUNG|nr:hypothetical protein INT48_006780 [Thamnidium elegans]
MTNSIKSTKASTIRRGGIKNSKRSSSRQINPAIVYDFALRCAIRANLEQQENKSTTSGISPTTSLKKKKDERHSLHHSFSSLTDIFSDTKQTDKLTREIVKGLIRRLEDVYKERDTSKVEYVDTRFRAVCKLVKKSLSEHRYRPTGTINDTVILFLKSSESQLKNDPDKPALWYDDLQKFITRYVEIVIQTIQQDAPSAATPELLEKLSVFCTPPNSQKGSVVIDKRSSSSSSTTTAATSELDSIINFPMIVFIKELFQVDDDEHYKKLLELVPICTESALLNDLKKCINHVHTNSKKDDFPTLQAYENWQKTELKQLTELMNSMMLMNPNLSIAPSNEIDYTNLLSRQNSNDSYNSLSSQNSDTLSFTFIPSDPRNCFRFLMNACLDRDIENFSSVPESERSKTSVLTHPSDELLRECWKTWRLSSPFRAILYLTLAKSKFDKDELSIEDINEAIRSLDKRDNLVRVLESLNNSLLHQLADGLSKYWKISPGWVQDIVDLLEKIYSHPIYLEVYPNPKSEFSLLEDIVKGAAVERWSKIEGKSKDPEADDLINLINMADNLSKELFLIAEKKFREPIMETLFIPSIVMARQMPYFALEMENWSYSQESKSCPVDIAFELYRKVLSLEKLYDQYGPEHKKSLFKVESWFLPHVKRWLIKTNESTIEWVDNAIAEDKFQRVSDNALHSSSIIDLFSMFNQAVDFVTDLEWPNTIQHCLFETFLSKIIGEGIQHYCYALEDLVKYELYSNRFSLDLPAEVRSASILEKARYQIMGGRGLQKLEGVPEDLCVKLNDIEAARGKLDRLYQVMHVDEIAQFMRQNLTSQSNYKSTQNNHLYTIKVIRAENLQPLDKNGLSDPYVTFEIDRKPVMRTRTVYETLNPRWDEEFDIWLSGERTVEVLAVVNDEDVITADEECGVVWFKLSPEYYDDFLTHELVLDLSPQGTLVLRISMEGEKNDIQFWFGKAFRTLKRSEHDIAGLIVDKMGPYIRRCLSRQVIDKLLKRDNVGFFSAFTRATSKQVDPDLQDCENAIAPLLDFLESNLKILSNNLSEVNIHTVVLKVWQEILRTLDSILLPPLSEYISEVKPLDMYQLHVVFKWLELLKIFFNGGEDGDAIPLESLENETYHALLAINVSYNLDTENLIQEYKLTYQKSSPRASWKLTAKRPDRSKTVYHSKHTIRHGRRNSIKKEEKSKCNLNELEGDAILRLLRMRHDRQAKDFLSQEFEKRNGVPGGDVSELVVRDQLPESPTSLTDQQKENLSHRTIPSEGVTLTD